MFKVHMPRSAARAARKVLTSGYIGEGPRTALFEERLSGWLGEEHVVVLDSCTSALELALNLAGVGPGSTVVSSPLTCLAGNAAILNRGAAIRWADIDPRTGNMSPESLERVMRPDVSAVVFTDWGGAPAEAERIQRMARRHGALTIEDAASAIGARARNAPPSASADFVCYSFQAVKHLTTINGGAIVSADRSAMDRARLLRWYGLPRLPGKVSNAALDTKVSEVGYKMQLNDVSSAIGLIQLDYIDEILKAHRDHAAWLGEALDETAHYRPQAVAPGSLASHLFLTVLADSPASREALAQVCEKAGIATSIVHRRNDSYAAFDAYRTELAGVDEFSKCMLGLPCGWWLGRSDLRRISKAIREADRLVS